MGGEGGRAATTDDTLDTQQRHREGKRPAGMMAAATVLSMKKDMLPPSPSRMT